MSEYEYTTYTRMYILSTENEYSWVQYGYTLYIYIYIYIWEYRYALVMNEPYAWISIFWIFSFSVCSVRVYAHALFLSSVPYSHYCSVITECTVRELKRRYRCAVTRARVARLLSIERDLKTALSDDAAYVLRFLPSRRPANWSFAAPLLPMRRRL